MPDFPSSVARILILDAAEGYEIPSEKNVKKERARSSVSAAKMAGYQPHTNGSITPPSR